LFLNFHSLTNPLFLLPLYEKEKYADLVVHNELKQPLAGIHTRYCKTHEAYIVEKSYSSLEKGFGFVLYSTLFDTFQGMYFCPDRRVCLPKAFAIWNRLFHQGGDILNYGFPSNSPVTTNPDHALLNRRYIRRSLGSNNSFSSRGARLAHLPLVKDSMKVFKTLYQEELGRLEGLLSSGFSLPPSSLCRNPNPKNSNGALG
jgi:hypothetical protein